MKCPECTYETSTPQQLGRHRRAVHGVLGKNAENAENSKRRSKRSKVQCPECKEYFKGLQGMVTHMRKSHALNPDSTPYTGSDTNLAKSIKQRPASQANHEIVKAEIVVKPHRHKNKGVQHAPNYSELKELYVYLAAHLEALIRRVAFEHDLPERRVAQGFSAYLHGA